jgi:hypothetical protein
VRYGVPSKVVVARRAETTERSPRSSVRRLRADDRQVRTQEGVPIDAVEKDPRAHEIDEPNGRDSSCAGTDRQVRVRVGS